MAVATAAAAVAATAAVVSTVQQRNASRKAASQQRQANIDSARVLEAAGRESEAAILRQAAEALETAGLGAEEAEQRIAPFLPAGEQAFLDARNQILERLPVGGAISDSIRNASEEFVRSNPGIFSGSGTPVQNEISRQARIAVSGATPAFDNSLLTAARQGVATAGDLAGIRQRGFDRLADIVQSQGAQRAGVLVGAGPQLQQLAAGSREARLLSDVAGQQAQSNIAETLAGAAGQIRGLTR